MKTILTTLFITISALSLHSQVVFKETFNYSTGNLTGNSSWTAYQAAESQPVKVLEGGLTLNNYVLTDTDGKAVKLNPTTQGTEDVWASFGTEITSGSVFLSFLVKVDLTTPASNTNPLEFVSLSSVSNAVTRARLCAIETSASTYKFRLVWGATASQFMESSNYSYGSTYLVVLKYNKITGADNDQISLHVFDSNPPVAEPTPSIPAFSYAGEINPGGVRLQQLGPSATPTTTTPQNITIDGIAITRSWDDFHNGTLPVSLISFSGRPTLSGIKLNWKTSSETDHDHFEILRRGDDKTVLSLGKIYGQQNSATIKEYVFEDLAPVKGNNYYSLKQVDKNGTSKVFGPVTVKLSSAPLAASVYVTEHSLNININNEKPNSSLDMTLYSMDGRKIFQGTKLLKNSGYQQVYIPLELDHGLYIAKLEINGIYVMNKVLK